MLEINASFTAQQWRIITQKAGESGKDPAEFLTQGLENYAALEDFSSVSPQGVFHPPTVEELLPEGYRIRQEVQLQPVSGKAIELQAGDLLLIRQTEGRQC